LACIQNPYKNGNNLNIAFVQWTILTKYTITISLYVNHSNIDNSNVIFVTFN
jgi:hypothetical protein